ncbi:MAG: tetratricopeptide repeat protein, partial [Deferribacterales bacterium]
MMLFFGRKDKTFQDAMSLYSKKNYKQTVKACGEILVSQPDNFEAMNLMGDAYCMMSDKEKSLEVYDALLKKFEGGNYLDKSIALVKKIIRNYPDKENYQEKLADLYGQKGLVREQISIFTALLESRTRRGFAQETDRLVRRLTSVKSANSSDIAALIDVMRRFGSSNEVRLTAEKGLGLKKIDPADLTLFINCAVETGADSQLYIKHLPGYIKSNPEKLPSLTDVIAEHLEKNFDKAYFAEIVNSAELSALVPLLVRLKRKYPKPEVYSYLLENAVSEGHEETFEHILAEIASVSDAVLDYSFAKMCFKFIEEMKTIATLESMRTIVEKAQAMDMKHQVLDLLREAYARSGDKESALRIEDELYGRKSGLIGEEKEADTLKIASFDHADDPEVDAILDYSLMDSVPSRKKAVPEPDPVSVPVIEIPLEPETDDFSIVTSEFDLDSFAGEPALMNDEGLDLDKFASSSSEKETGGLIETYGEREIEPTAAVDEPEISHGIIQLDDDFDETEIFGDIEIKPQPKQAEPAEVHEQYQPKTGLDDLFDDLEIVVEKEEAPKKDVPEAGEISLDDLTFDFDGGT